MKRIVEKMQKNIKINKIFHNFFSGLENINYQDEAVKQFRED